MSQSFETSTGMSLEEFGRACQELETLREICRLTSDVKCLLRKKLLREPTDLEAAQALRQAMDELPIEEWRNDLMPDYIGLILKAARLVDAMEVEA